MNECILQRQPIHAKSVQNKNSEVITSILLKMSTIIPDAMNTFCCIMCKQSFMEKMVLDSHMVFAHNKLYTCNLCALYFENDAERAQHSLVHTEQRQNVCNICNSSIDGSLDDLVKHMTKHVNSSEQLMCRVCIATFPKNSFLKMHMVTHADENQYICKECSVIFNQKFHFTFHMSLHIEELFKDHMCLKNANIVNPHTLSEEGSAGLKICAHLQDAQTSTIFTQFFCEPIDSVSGNGPCSLVDVTSGNLHLKPVIHQYQHSNSSGEAAEFFNHPPLEECGKQVDGDDISKETDIPFTDKKNHNTFYEKELAAPKRRMRKPPLERGIRNKRFAYKGTVKKLVSSKQNKPKKTVTPLKQLCSICSKEFSSLKELTAHNRTHKKNTDCRLSLKLYDCHKELGEGSEIGHTAEHVYKCDECSRSFKRKSSLVKHMRLHNGKKLLHCDQCAHTSIDHRDMRIHMQSHRRDTPYLCHICQKQFKWKHSLTLHIQVHSGERQYSCEICKKTFSHKGSLNIHMRTHTGEKPFLCNFCSKLFSQKGQLDVHILRVHLGEKPFPCSICDKRFAQKIDMKTHMRSHTGEKPFQCSFCSKTFKHKFRMVTHIRTHTGEKPYTCIQCSKTFTKREKLTRHLRVHTGEKPFICKICSRSFAQRETLNNHMRTHDGLKPFSCQICSKLFSLRGSLRSHMRVHRETDDRLSGKCTNEKLPPTGNSAALIEQNDVELTPLVNSNQSTQLPLLTQNNSHCLDKRNYLIDTVPVSELYSHPSVPLNSDIQNQSHDSNIYTYRDTNVLSLNSHPVSYNIHDSINRL